MLPCIVRWFILFWALRILRSKVGSHSPGTSVRTKGKHCALWWQTWHLSWSWDQNRGASSQLRKASSCLTVWLRTQEWEHQKKPWASLGTQWSRAQRSHSLLTRFSSRHGHITVAWSCPTHGAMGFTPHIYTTPVLLTEEIFYYWRKDHTGKQWSWGWLADCKVSLKLIDRYGCLTKSKKLGTIWVFCFAMA